MTKIENPTMSFADQLREVVSASGLRYGHPTPTISEWYAKWRDDHLEEIKTRAMSCAKKGIKEIRNIELSLGLPNENLARNRSNLHRQSERGAGKRTWCRSKSWMLL